MESQDLKTILVASLLGLILGLERERAHTQQMQALGVRSFILLSLLGAAAAISASVPISVAVSGFALLSVIVGYLRSTHSQKSKNLSPSDIGLTTEIAGALSFCIGYLSYHKLITAVALTAIVLAVLVSRKRLHFFSRFSIQAAELEAFSLIFLLMLGVAPALPKTAIDPFGLFVPQKIVFLIGLIGCIQFAAHMSSRFFSAKYSHSLTGFFGGFVSSTAVFLWMSRSSNPKTHSAPLIGALFAALASHLIELFLIVFVISSSLGIALLPFLVFLIGSTLLITFFSNRHRGIQTGDDSSNFTPESPIQIREMLKLTAMVLLMLSAVGAIHKYLGSQAMLLASFLSGLFELHSLSFAIGNQVANSDLDLKSGELCLVAAVSASFIAKAVIAIYYAKGDLKWKVPLFMSVCLVPALILYFLT